MTAAAIIALAAMWTVVCVVAVSCCTAAGDADRRTPSARDAATIAEQAEQIEDLRRALRDAQAQALMDGRALAHHLDQRGLR